MSRIYEPQTDRLLVRRTPEPEEVNGILLARNEKEKPYEGTIVGAGPDAAPLKSGLTVLFGRYCGTNVEVDGETLLFLRKDDILAIVRETEQ